MPKNTNVRLNTPNATPNSKATVYPLPVQHRPLFPWAGEDPTAQVMTPLPYPEDLTSGDGADRSFRPNPMGSYSTNVPQPDNKGPVKNSGDQGLGVM